MQNKAQILFLTSELNLPGGLERMVASLANQLSKYDYKVSLLIAGNDTTCFYKLETGITTTALSINFGIGSDSSFLTKKIEFIKDTINLRSRIDLIRPDIIITNDYSYTSALALLRLHKRYKIVHWQLSSFKNKKSYSWERLSRWALRQVFAVIAINKDEAKICNLQNIDCRVIPNFLSLHNSRAKADSHTILTIAKLSEVKGIDLLMDVASIVLKKYSAWKWKVVGSGPLQRSLQDFIDKSGLKDRLFLEQPHTHDLKEEYLNTALYVLPSRMESFGMVLLEAMSYGIPCIAFDCETGPRHIISHNMDGLLVEKENTKKMADALSSLIEDKEKRSQLGNAAFINVKRFADENVIALWEDLFNQ